MEPLDKMDIGHRVMLTVAIIIILLILLACAGYLSGRWEVPEAQAAPRSYVDDLPISKYEEHLLALDREALDKAYKDHIGLVFGVWMKDPNDPQAPHRAGTGARNARAGYSLSIEKIEQREQRLKDAR